MNPLMKEIEARWHKMFTSLAGGDDVTPSLRLRTEGMMEAIVLAGSASSAQVTRCMEKSYLSCFGSTLAEDFNEDWQVFFPFPQIPAMGKRAPVYPSTAN